jgi:hypothetical protein
MLIIMLVYKRLQMIYKHKRTLISLEYGLEYSRHRQA